MRVLVDANVLLDVITEDPKWFGWSSTALAEAGDTSVLAINLVIYTEVSVHFDRIEDVEDALALDTFVREPIPWEAGFLAGKSFLQYRRRGGRRRAPLPDFFIGAHATIAGMTLLTRDPSRYRTYYPGLSLIAPPEE